MRDEAQLRRDRHARAVRPRSARPAAPALPALPAPPAPPARSAAQPPPAQPKPKTELFAPQDLGLLEAPDRDQWQKPDQIMDALGIAEGSVVADLGAGGGWFTLRLARRVGPNGLVYAEDIQPAMLEVIRQRMQRENLTERPSRSSARRAIRGCRQGSTPRSSSTRFTRWTIRRIPLVITLLRNVARSLKPQGRLGIVDFTPGGGGPGPAPDQRVDPTIGDQGGRSGRPRADQARRRPAVRVPAGVRAGLASGDPGAP